MPKLSTESYKGVRDFYPEEMFIQKHIFDVWRKSVERFGYQEYGASVLEPTELYRAKSGEEIVNEQTYSFRDRGDRDVTLRPEMTPTVARMVAARKRELGFPLRWYSIPNLFRYEQPQRGRLREHWQLNVDIFGVESEAADAEIILLAYEIMIAFGAKTKDFQIRINSRKLINLIYKSHNIEKEQGDKIARVMDKKEKISPEEFKNKLEDILGKDKMVAFLTSLDSPDWLNSNSEQRIKIREGSEMIDLVTLLNKLISFGIPKEIINYSPALIRGFDYYTDMVFEIFDTNPANRRSLFGGGRYDNLTELFGGDKIPAVGFGMGDVTMRDFLETHDLLPAYASSAKLYLCPIDEKYLEFSQSLAERLREKGVAVALDYSDRKIGDRIKTADKQSIPFIMIVGEDETKSQLYKIKNLATGTETLANEVQLAELLLQQ